MYFERGVVVWDVLFEILRAMQGQEEGKKAESDRGEKSGLDSAIAKMALLGVD